MGKLIDLTGKRFGRLLVVEKSESKNGYAAWLCRCDCGNEKIISGNELRKGKAKSCGCLRKEVATKTFIKHGKTNTLLYEVWKSMKARCNNLNNKRYSSYGGRGITVCDEWRESFQAFYDWAMINGYREGLSIDRIDNDGNYEPSNCRWATASEQQKNKRKKQ